MALYEALIPCTWPVVGADGTVTRRYFGVDMSQVPPVGASLTVPKGQVVGKAFKPMDAEAEADRADQLVNPEKYVNGDEFTLTVLAELIVKDTGMRDTIAKDDKGVKRLVRTAVEDAKALILGCDVADVKAAVDPHAAAIAKIMHELDDAGMRKLLKDNDVKYFRGLKEGQLAEVIYKHELHLKL